jgi:hypothetical protein
MAQSALRDSSPPRGLLPVWIRLHERRETVVVLVTANNTVLDVKDVINKTENILQEQQHLLCGTTRFRKQVRAKHASVLDDARTIGSYLPRLESRSSNDNTVELLTRSAIFVTLASGAKLQLNVVLDYDSLPDVKQTIEEKTKIPVALQHLMLAGVIQDDADWLSLEERGIWEGDTLHLVVSSAEVVSPLPAARAACAAIIDEYLEY